MKKQPGMLSLWYRGPAVVINLEPEQYFLVGSNSLFMELLY